MGTLKLSKIRSSIVKTFLAALVAAPGIAMAIEEPKYTIESTHQNYEIRKYLPVIVAEMRVDAEFVEAGNIAFQTLAGYIFGNNRNKTKLEVSEPVTQAAASEKIAMTAPVSQIKSQGGYWIQFTMPASYSLETLPMTNDQRVHIRRIPGRRVAVLKYSGSCSEEKYNRKLEELRQSLAKDNLVTVGEPVFARFNSPFALWFLRRNEIWLELGS